MRETRAAAKSFEDLHLFDEARTLARRVYELTRSGTFAKDYGLVDQVRRTAVSILSNIAEGFERQSDAEFVRSLFIAKGSCGELRAQLLVAQDLKYISSRDHDELSTQCRRISAGLYNLISYLRRRQATRQAKTI